MLSPRTDPRRIGKEVRIRVRIEIGNQVRVDELVEVLGNDQNPPGCHDGIVEQESPDTKDGNARGVYWVNSSAAKAGDNSNNSNRMLFMSGQVVVNPYQRLFYFPEGRVSDNNFPIKIVFNRK